jgi:hypothetical protein
LAVTHLAAQGQSVWFVRIDAAGGHIGRVSVGEDRPFEVRAGPAPTALAIGSAGVYVVEGVPDQTDPSDPRVNVLERLDPQTLEVIASAPLAGLPTDVAVSGETVWVAGTRGMLSAFDTVSLAVRPSTPLTGRGPASMAANGDRLYVVNGQTDPEPAFLVHTVNTGNATLAGELVVPGSGSEALIAAATDLWIATPADSGRGSLYRISPDGVADQPLTVARIASMTVASDALWWITTQGDVETLGLGTDAPSAPVTVGASGQAMAIAGEHIWVASDELILLHLDQ